MMETTDPGR